MSGLLDTLARLTRLQLAVQGLTSDWQTRAEEVAMYRRYDDGDHDANMTAEMRTLLRLPPGASEFNENYIPVVIDTMADRLRIAQMEADNADTTAWAGQMLELNGFDRMQRKVHRSALCDGDSFVMIGWDNARRVVRLTHEPAFDGIEGIIPVYASATNPEMHCALKIWHELTDASGRLTDTVRANIYYPDRLEKYWMPTQALSLQPYTGEGDSHIFAWGGRGGEALGIPLVHFRNRERGYSNFGLSEVAGIIPQQNILNRGVQSLARAAEVAGFPNRLAIGFTPPSGLGPGDWIVVDGGGLDKDYQITAAMLEPGDLSQILAALADTRRVIGNVSRTPAPELFPSDNLSGEAFKQRESSLIGKCYAFQLYIGPAWEAVLDKAWAIQSAFGERPPTYGRFYTRWAKPTLRSDRDVVDMAGQMLDRQAVSKRRYLKMVAEVFDWDDTLIEEIVSELDEEQSNARAASLRDFTANAPDFGGAALDEALGFTDDETGDVTNG